MGSRHDTTKRTGLIAVLAVAAVAAIVLLLPARGTEAAQTGSPSGAVRHALRLFSTVATGLVSPEQAVETATRQFPGAAVEVELEGRKVDGTARAVWEVVVVSADAMHEVAVDAHTGRVLSSEADDDDREAAAFRRALAGDGLTLADALRKGSAAGETILAAELDREGGEVVFELERVTGGDVDEILFSRATGAEVEDDDDDDDDDDDEDEDEDDDDDDD